MIGLVGLLTRDVNVVGNRTHRGVGGAALYMARALEALGVPYALLTAVGEDFPVDACSSWLTRGGSVRWIRYGAKNIVFRNVYEGTRRVQYVAHAGYRFKRRELIDFCERVRPACLAVVPVMGEVASSDVEGLSERFVVALDPQGLVRSVQQGKVVGRSVDPRHFRRCRVLKLSVDELPWLFATPAALVDFIGAYAGLLAITLGARGSVLIEKRQVVQVPALPVVGEVDPTGAGDVYLAGLLYGLQQGMTLAELGAVATAVSYSLIQHGPAQLKRCRTFVDAALAKARSIALDPLIALLFEGS